MRWIKLENQRMETNIYHDLKQLSDWWALGRGEKERQ